MSDFALSTTVIKLKHTHLFKHLGYSQSLTVINKKNLSHPARNANMSVSTQTNQHFKPVAHEQNAIYKNSYKTNSAKLNSNNTSSIVQFVD